MSLRNKMTMLISSCDAYSDLWDGHVELLNRNWPKRDFEVYLVTDASNSRSFDGVEVFAAGSGKELPQRLGAVLARITTPYVLLTLDDYYPIVRIDESEIAQLITVMDALELDYVRLFKRPRAKRPVEGHRDLYWIDFDGNYRVNLYAGIWRVDFLRATISEELNAWQYEVSLTEKAIDYGARCVMSLGHEFETLDVVRKGKILLKARRYFRKDPVYVGNREAVPILYEAQIGVRTFMTEHLPSGVIRLLKRVMVKFGSEFYTGLS